MADEDNPPSNPSTTETDPSEHKRLEVINRIVKKLIGPYMDIQAEGFKRIERLLSVAKRIDNDLSAQSILAGEDLEHDAVQEILRAAVVLIHAHLEEFLRTMSAVLLPEGDETCLNEIPIAGGGGKDKFGLGTLVQHKGKLVDDLLRDSVSEYLERSNYNSTAEIARLLKKLGFEVSEHNKFFPYIQQMIERRHKIVHRADRFVVDNSSTSLQPISFEDVARWSSATHELMFSLISPLLHKLAALEVKKPSTTE